MAATAALNHHAVERCYGASIARGSAATSRRVVGVRLAPATADASGRHRGTDALSPRAAGYARTKHGLQPRPPLPSSSGSRASRAPLSATGAPPARSETKSTERPLLRQRCTAAKDRMRSRCYKCSGRGRRTCGERGGAQRKLPPEEIHPNTRFLSRWYV